MLITFDLDTCQLIHGPGFLSPLTSLEAKRGDGEDIQLQLLRNGQLWQAPGSAELVVCVKKWGDFAADAAAHALANSFAYVDELQRYEAAMNYNTELLLPMFLASGANPNGKVVDLMLEAAYRPSSALTWRRSTNAIRLTLHNSVWRGTEASPSGGTGTELLPTNYLTKDRVIEYLPICTGLLGGGTANLDGLATAASARAVNSAVAMIDNTAGIDILRVYELVSGNVAEAAPTIIRPDDFDATTNPRVWRLRTSRVNFDPDSYLLRSASVEWLAAVLGHTGGGSTKLDGVATVSRAVESIVAFVDNNGGSPVLRHYELVAGTTAEVAPDVIRPDDYHATTNAKVWILRGGSGTGSEYLTHATGIAVLGAVDLSSLVTVGVAVGKVITKNGYPPYPFVYDTAVQFWMLASAADATAISEGRTADIVTPTDWHATTNNKKWVQLHAGGYGSKRPLSLAMEGQVPVYYSNVGALVGTAVYHLQSIVTAGVFVGREPLICVTIGTTLYFYKLVAGTDTTSSPTVLRPNDYNATTNAKVWRKLTIG